MSDVNKKSSANVDNSVRPRSRSVTPTSSSMIRLSPNLSKAVAPRRRSRSVTPIPTRNLFSPDKCRVPKKRKHVKSPYPKNRDSKRYNEEDKADKSKADKSIPLVTYLLSLVTCHLSLVTCLLSLVSFVFSCLLSNVTCCNLLLILNFLDNYKLFG